MTAADVTVVTETLPGSRVGLTIEVPPEQVERAYARVLDRLSQRVRIEGFRPGRAPRPLVEARVGAAAIRDEVADALVPSVVTQALRDRSIEPVDQPEVEIQELERGRPARFTARVAVRPEVGLPDLDALRVERPRTTVDDAMVERRLAALCERLAQVEPVEREVREGDVVVADLRVLADGREVPGEARTATEIELREGAGPPELLAALPGRSVGDVAGVDVTWPADHPVPERRGRPARFELTVRGVKEKRVPELTDEVAAELSGGERATVAELREAVRDDLVASAVRLDELAFEQAALTAVVEAARVEIPRAMVEREVQRQMDDLERQLGQRGLRLDRYLEHVKTTDADYRAGIEPDAEGRVRTDLVLEELGRRMAIDPSEDEVTAYLRAEIARDEESRGRAEELARSAVAREYFRHRLTRLRVLEELVARLGGGHDAASGGGEAAGLKTE